MTEYTSSIATALRLIIKKGAKVTLQRFTDGAPPDPEYRFQVGAPVKTSCEPRAVMVSYGVLKPDTEDFRQDDMKCLIAAGDPNLTFDPQAGDVVLRANGEQWSVIRAGPPLQPADEKVLWQLQVRRWPLRTM
jgi:hypothetical protein